MAPTKKAGESASGDVTDDVESALAAADVLLAIAARSVLEVESLVTTPQLRVLMLIATAGPRNLGDVAAELSVHPSNATRTCERLVQAGLVARTDDPRDRRFVRLTLTPRGSALVDTVLTHRRAAFAAVLDRMPAEQRASVTDAFAVFARVGGVKRTPDGRFALSLHPHTP